MILQVKAPSNIAIVKYMGKNDPSQNLPANPSLSMTLSSLCTLAFARVEEAKSFCVELIPESPAEGYRVPDLSEKARNRMLDHSKRVAQASSEILSHHGLETSTQRSLSLKVGNSFPAGAGIASSASSFAAVTLATLSACARDPRSFAQAFLAQTALKREVAELSRKGSGSSCRSFEGPWVLWNETHAVAVEHSKLEPMTDLVLIVDPSTKKVGSSEAHLRVKTSPLWIGRQERTQKRCFLLQEAIQNSHLPTIAEIAWQEAWEMHSLFHTSQPPFTYWKPGTLEFLEWVEPLARAETDPWIVTLDAGPNLHCIVPARMAASAKAKMMEHFGELQILEDHQGMGATLEV